MMMIGALTECSVSQQLRLIGTECNTTMLTVKVRSHASKTLNFSYYKIKLAVNGDSSMTRSD